MTLLKLTLLLTLHIMSIEFNNVVESMANKLEIGTKEIYESQRRPRKNTKNQNRIDII